MKERTWSPWNPKNGPKVPHPLAIRHDKGIIPSHRKAIRKAHWGGKGFAWALDGKIENTPIFVGGTGTTLCSFSTHQSQLRLHSED